uniref:Magnesium transporter MgtE n=1 Tax=uncultured Thiotrichaceae bacterium TaxID=298394 RepID=A0A6S6TI62_9GAMM|nr:MAG: Magnesium transporter MgtE [uncultured Thiotrichaceae bacterium]
MTDDLLQATQTTAATTDLIKPVMDGLSDNDPDTLQQLLADKSSGEIGHLLESLPVISRTRLWPYIPEHQQGSVLAAMGESARLSLSDHLDNEQVIEAVTHLEGHDLVEVLPTLPHEIADAVRSSLEDAVLQELDATLAFPEKSAGRLLDRKVVAIRSHTTLETVLRFLRFHQSIPKHTTGLMVIDRQNKFQGELLLSDLLTHSPDCLVTDIMHTDVRLIAPEMPQHELAALFREQGLTSVPVVGHEGELLGRITADEMADILQESAEHQILGAVGLDEGEDLFSPIIPSARRRLFWLGLNLMTAFLAAWVIGLFAVALDKIVALAVLMPIVASMGGIAGGQTLTLVIRGLATNTISSANAKWLAYKEITISAISGITWAVVVGIASYLWFNDIRISSILAAAMVVNLLVAALCGFGIPLLMKRVGIDPALAGGVVLTTATDVVGFVSFLGLATLFLL